MVTEKEAQQFNHSPIFHIHHLSTLLNDPIPPEIETHWLRLSRNKKLILLRSKDDHEENVNYTLMNLQAKEIILSSLKLLNDEWPLSYLVLAEANYWVGAKDESLRLLKVLQRLLPRDDCELDRIIECVEKVIQLEEKEDEEYHNTKGLVYTCEFSSPFACPCVGVDETSMHEVVSKWKSLKGKDDDIEDQFIRLACISTNLIENVFELGVNSRVRLIRNGFNTNSIEAISKISKISRKGTVISILNNTQECYHSISKCLEDINVNFFKKLHSSLMENDKFETYEENGCEGIRLIRIGEFRKVACITYHKNETEVTEYCHHAQIEKEMENYCNLAQELLRNDQFDPFVKCAWLQWAFLRIHPFEDGNGRVSRIISSIPLYQYGLPPIVVNPKDKSEYFSALNEADRNKDLVPLAMFLRKSLLNAISDIEQLPAIVNSTNGTNKYRKRIPGRKFL